MKIGACAIIKNENLYLRDWVEYHLRLGFDKIFIYDNNDTEYLEGVIYDYIMNGKVEVTPWIRYMDDSSTMYDLLATQIAAYNDCIDKHNDFDWITFIDGDEFIHLTNHSNVHDLFENDHIYIKYDAILMSWKMMGDPDALYYDQRPLWERFTKPLSGIYAGVPCNQCVKPFVNIQSGVRFGTSYCPNNPHSPDTSMVCNSLGRYVTGWAGDFDRLTTPRHEMIYVDHYYTKSLIEYLIKSVSCQHRFYNNNGINFEKCITQYKNLNGWTDKHENVYQDFLNRFNKTTEKNEDNC